MELSQGGGALGSAQRGGRYIGGGGEWEARGGAFGSTSKIEPNHSLPSSVS